jgi:hypothetical protein
MGNERHDSGVESEAVMPIQSPEVTGLWVCACGNDTQFGVRDGFAQYQRIDVLRQGSEHRAAILQRGQIVNGGRGAVLRMIILIECRICGLTVWRIEYATDSGSGGEGGRETPEDAVARVQSVALGRRNEARQRAERATANDLGETFTTGSQAGFGGQGDWERALEAMRRRIAPDHESVEVVETGGRPGVSGGVRPEADGGHPEAGQGREEQVLRATGETASGSEPTVRGQALEAEGSRFRIELNGYAEAGLITDEMAQVVFDENLRHWATREVLRRRLFGEEPWPEE